MPDLTDIILHDEQNPTVLTEARLIFAELTRRYTRILERAAIVHLMEMYQVRNQASVGGYAGTVEARAHQVAATSLLDTAGQSELSCRSLDRLAKIARRKLRNLYSRSLQ